MGPNGLALYSEFDWKWSREGHFERVKGRWGFIDQGEFRYTNVEMAFDGRKVRTLNYDNKVGRMSGPDDTFDVWYNPLLLIGIDLAFVPRRNLYDVLEDVVLVKSSDAPSGLLVLKGRFVEGFPIEAQVWLDPDVGFLPQRIEMWDVKRNVLNKVIENRRFKEVSPGVRLVVEGELCLYSAKAVYPEGITSASALKLGPKEKEDLLEKIKYKADPMGYGTRTFVFDEASVRVNEPFGVDEFTLTYPPGSRVMDTETGKLIRYQGPEVAGAATNRKRFYILIAMNLCIVLAAVAFLVYRRHRSQTAGTGAPS